MIMEVRQYENIDEINKHLKAFRNMEVKDVVPVLVSSGTERVTAHGGFEKIEYYYNYLVTFQEVKDDSRRKTNKV